MILKFAKILVFTLKFLEKIIFKPINKKLLVFIKKVLEDSSYKTKKANGKDLLFFTPNELCEMRVETLFTKEPETIKWIDNFSINSNSIFWDIGANIGLYSIYAAAKHKNLSVISFEPALSNLRVLSRNISINNFSDEIKIFQVALSNKNNTFQEFNESIFQEGGSLNTFGEKFGFDGNLITKKNSYSIYGTTLNYLVENKILEIPDYIKIDVDGIEHLILSGANKFLKNDKIKGICIEINEKFLQQKKSINDLLTNSDFIFQNKATVRDKNLNDDFSDTFNFFYIRNFENKTN
jgi:FkbM family methyltransferase